MTTYERFYLLNGRSRSPFLSGRSVMLRCCRSVIFLVSLRLTIGERQIIGEKIRLLTRFICE